jgi:hypothetical protein
LARNIAKFLVSILKSKEIFNFFGDGPTERIDKNEEGDDLCDWQNKDEGQVLSTKDQNS